jgi:hypothetical protein
METLSPLLAKCLPQQPGLNLNSGLLTPGQQLFQAYQMNNLKKYKTCKLYFQYV